ncbi:murein hydrolase activator EnvC family protein [Micromonospora carbonacea]|uniref:murein hydrolase activator EnvC family protein n=1 Tax=Micromonospora carbonacea TaxID=47853 RepID=UPI00371BBC89
MRTRHAPGGPGPDRSNGRGGPGAGGGAVRTGGAPAPNRPRPAAAAGFVLCGLALAAAAAPGPVASIPVVAGAAVSVPVAVDPVVAGAVVAGPGSGLPAFGWPLDGVPRPARRFEPPPQPWLPGHRGVDLIAEPGAVVRAAGPGVVLHAGQVAGRPVITVGHSAGLRTTYEPVTPGVRVGDRVAAGASLGRLEPGHAGCPDRACLHWGLRRGEEYLDPTALLGLGPVRLLPL